MTSQDMKHLILICCWCQEFISILQVNRNNHNFIHLNMPWNLYRIGGQIICPHQSVKFECIDRAFVAQIMGDPTWRVLGFLWPGFLGVTSGPLSFWKDFPCRRWWLGLNIVEMAILYHRRNVVTPLEYSLRGNFA